MERWRGKVAIVTGASSGIGAAIAASLVHHGLQVVGLAIQEDKLKNLAEQLCRAGEPGCLHPVKTDLRKEGDILTAFQWVEQELGGADILVNNAGLFYFDFLTDGKIEEWRAMLEVNTLAPAICIREYLRSMNDRNNQNGHIFLTCRAKLLQSFEILGSSLGFNTARLLSTLHNSEYQQYKKTPSQQTSANRPPGPPGRLPGHEFVLCIQIHATGMVLRRELALKNSTIKVTSISPGAVKTDIYKQEDKSVLSAAPDAIVTLDPSDVAGIVVNALSATEKTQFCEVVVTPVPTMIAPY